MRHLVLVVIAVVLGSCATETTPSPSTTAAAPVVGTTSTTEPEGATTLPATTTTMTGPELDVEIREGEVAGPDRFEYRTGETVSITVVADTEYELHVHGYDLRYDLEPGILFTIEFTADVPGIFEVETHPGQLVVFHIEISG